MTISELERLQEASRIGFANWESETEAPCGHASRRALAWSAAALMALALAFAL